MAATPIRLALRGALRDVKYVGAVPPRRAAGLVGEVYRQVERDFGMLAPPIALHSPAPSVLAASWTILRESLVASGAASRADKEIVASAVSRANTCPYCVEVHGMALGSLGKADAAAAISGDQEIEDPSARALAGWARGDGGTVAPELKPELIGVAVTFHYLNRMVNVFLGPSPLPAAVPASARRVARAVLGQFLKPSDASPGASLVLLPDAPPPGDLAWAKGNDTITAAFTRAIAAVDAAARVSVPARVREVVQRELAFWPGTSAALSASWVEPAIAGLPLSERAAARLALLTAIASYQVDESVVDTFRRYQPSDAALVELVAWASLSAARSLGKRLLFDVNTSERTEK
ncbi:carboxymuconolactone decarboxylase family protein [Amycolatopsis sp. cg5]|uniref:carboxymuconolactone decarboxylase family protein n=1 Tax=Amycolatopsis sp. cg5 TaxID=3238802 RepID=UPI0035253448